MDRIILHIGVSLARAFRLRLPKGGAPEIEAGPLLRASGRLEAGDPGIWVEIVEPLRTFFAETWRGAQGLTVLTTQAEVLTYRLRAVPKTSNRELLKARLDVEEDMAGEGGEPWEMWWTQFDEVEEDGAKWRDFCLIRMETALARRLRELPEALGLGTAAAEIVPYPLAAARALQAMAPEPGDAALFDIGFAESFFTVFRKGAPVSCSPVDFSGAAVQKILTTPVAFLDSETRALTPEEAAILMGRLNLGALDEAVARESSPTHRQILQALGILVEETVHSVADLWRGAGEAEDAGQGPAGRLSSETPVNGLERLLGQTTGAEWRLLPPVSAKPETPGSPAAGFTPAAPLAVLGAFDATDSGPKWERLAEAEAAKPRGWLATQWIAGALLLALLGAWFGAGLGLWFTNLRIRHYEEAMKSRDAATRATFLKQVGLRAQAARRRAALLAPLLARDALYRRFLGQLARFHRANFVLDTLAFQTQPEKGGGNPEAVLTGRAESADRQLREFSQFLEGLPSVAQVVLDSVAQGEKTDAAGGLGCVFQLHVVLNLPEPPNRKAGKKVQ